MTSPRITVVGSINMDLVVRCAHLPTPGETIIADGSTEVSGGKGANQAVAAARVGGEVRIVGRVGDDAFAQHLITNLKRAGVNTDAIAATKQCVSGTAIVAVESSGQNSIMVIPGANGRVSAQDVTTHASIIQSADVLLLQLEIPLDAVTAAVDIARQAGVLTILDPAPIDDSFPRELLNVDVICPNQSEAAAIVGRSVETIDEARGVAQELRGMGAKAVVITLGDQGVVVSENDSTTWIEPVAVTPVDTTAAGDAFAGSLAVGLYDCGDLVQAARFANVAGAIAATRPGAQPAMPTRSEIEQWLARP